MQNNNNNNETLVPKTFRVEIPSYQMYKTFIYIYIYRERERERERERSLYLGSPLRTRVLNQ